MNSKGTNNVVDMPDGRPVPMDSSVKKKQSLPVHLNVLVICKAYDVQLALSSQFFLIHNLHFEFNEKTPKQFSQYDLVILAVDKEKNSNKTVIKNWLMKKCQPCFWVMIFQLK